MNEIERIIELRKQLHQHNYNYYVLSAPTISDKEFDISLKELQELEAKLTEDIMIENQKLNMQLADTVTNFLKEYNADGRYHVILSNSAKDNVLMAAESYNITNEVIEQLNARYKK